MEPAEWRSVQILGLPDGLAQHLLPAQHVGNRCCFQVGPLATRSLEKFPQIIGKLKGMLERFMQSLSCIDPCFIPDDTLERLPEPSVVGKAKVGGIDFNKARMRRVAEAVLALSWCPNGFTSSELADRVARSGPGASDDYSPRQAAYDLKKLRGKQMVDRVGKTRLSSDSGRPEGHRRLGGSAGESHPPVTGRRPREPAFPRVTEPDGARPSLRDCPRRHGGHLAGTRSGSPIDKQFVGLRP